MIADLISPRSLPLFLICLILCYGIGSVPTAWVVVKLKTGLDIRTQGSGNVGATNVVRLLGKKWGAPVFLFDAAKGILAFFFMSAWGFSQRACMIGGFLAVLGHNYPCWLKGKGGKGVSTTLGLVACLSPLLLLATLILWLVCFFLTRVVALASLIALALPPLYFAAAQNVPACVLTTALFGLSLWRHRSNLARLFRGEEKKF